MQSADRCGARRRRFGAALCVGGMAMLIAASGTATDLRGRVERQSAYSSILTPVNGMAVELLDTSGRQVLARYYTGPDGMYYFRNIRPGNYQLRAGAGAYPLTVQPMPSQDIGPIRMRL